MDSKASVTDSQTVVIKNAGIVLPDRVCDRAALVIRDGKIEQIYQEGYPVGENEQHRPGLCSEGQIIDAKGNYLLAGFEDLHVHGGGGADFMDGTLEAFETAAKAHLKHGTTTFLPTAMTAGEAELTEFIRIFHRFRRESAYSFMTPGVHLEGPYLSGANAKSSGAQPANHLRLPNEEEIDRLLAVGDGWIRRWDAAPELPGSDMFAHKMKEQGVICSIAHSNANGEEAQKGIDHGFGHVTHFYNAVTTYHKEGQYVHSGVVEAAYLNEHVSVELICDGKHIPKDVLRLALKIKGPERVMGITDAMRLAGTDLKSGKLGSLKSGTEVIVDDTVAKLPDMSSYAGSIATMDRCLRVLCKDYGITLPQASLMLSETPAALLGLSDSIGSIAVGKDANLVLVDSQFKVVNVWAKGREVCSD